MVGEQRDPYAPTYAGPPRGPYPGGPPPGPGPQWPPHPGWVPPPTGGVLRFTAAALLLLAALLVLIATLVPQTTYTFVSEYSGTSTTVSSGWTTTVDPPDPDRYQYFPYDALILTFAVALSAVAGVVLLVAHGAARTVARAVGAAASGALAAVGFVVVAGLLQSVQYDADHPDDAGFTSTVVIEVGGWLLLVGAVVALAAAAVLACLREG